MANTATISLSDIEILVCDFVGKCTEFLKIVYMRGWSEGVYVAQILGILGFKRLLLSLCIRLKDLKEKLLLKTDRINSEIQGAATARYSLRQVSNTKNMD